MTVPAPSDRDRLPALITELLDVATTFVELAYLSAGGGLTLALPTGSIRGIRLEVPAGSALHLRGLEIDDGGRADIAAVSRLLTSDAADGVDPAVLGRLLEPDGSRATVLRCGPDGGPAWVEIRFSRPVDVRRITLTNALGAESKLSRGLRVQLRGRWRSRTVYRWRPRMRAWRSRVADAMAAAPRTGDPDSVALVRVIDLVVRGEYQRSDWHLRSKVEAKERQRQFMQAANAGLLRMRELEWTIHGPSRSFRWWTDAQKAAYLGEALEVVDALRGLTPSVCLGFGSVLAVVRDGALIPHDNDLDVIVGFESDEAGSIADGLLRVQEFMAPLGFEVAGTNYSHRQVRRPGNRTVDVFAGVFEGDTVAWFPGPRSGLTRAIMFPPVLRDLMEMPCPVPAQPELYLERVYGPGWRVPDTSYKHSSDRTPFADIEGAQPVDDPPPGDGSAPGVEPDARERRSKGLA